MYTYFVSFKGGNKKNKKLFVTQSGYDSIESFFQFYTLLFLEMNANSTHLFLFNFETTPCKNHSDTNLVKIHYAVRLLSFVIFLFCAIFNNSSHFGIPNCKKYDGFVQETFWHKAGQFQPMGLEILSFSCLCYFY